MTEELNRRHNLATTPTTNNNGESYIVPFDIYKEGYDAYDISNWFKGRVGDNGTPFGIRWYKHGQLMDVTGMRPFIEGQVGDYTIDDSDPDDPKINMDSEASNVHVVGEVNDCQEYGVAIYRLINQAMPQSGIFYGKIGVMGAQDDGTTVMSSVDVVFKVLAGHMNMMGARKFYVSQLEKAELDFKKRLKDHDRDYQAKVAQQEQNYQKQMDDNNTEFQKNSANFKAQTDQIIADARNAYINRVKNSRDAMNALDSEVKANRAELTNINDHLSGVEQQIAIHDIVTIPQHQKDLKNISNAIDDRLANVKTAPVAVENASVLRQRYPNGADGIFISADTGHKWLWLSGKWTDCGQYQAIGIDDELIEPVKQQQKFDEEKISTNYNLISRNTTQLKENTVHLQEVQGAGQFVQIYLTDQDNKRITDQYGEYIVGKKWLPLVDKTLTQSDLPADAKAVGDAIQEATTFKPEKYGIPVLYLWGDKILSLKDKSKNLKNEVTYKFPHFHIQGTCEKFKVQGASSAKLPKKNYTLNFDQDFVAFPSYGKQHKYVIKANYTDASQSLNVVNAKLWGKIRATHCQDSDALQDNQGNYLVDDNGNHILAETDPQLSVGGNFGAVDGFPIAVYINDKYWGLYSFNIPKDDWMAKMPEKAGYAIVDAVRNPQGAFKAETKLENNMELQFCGTKDTTWVKTSINKLIDAVMADYSTGEQFDTAVSSLLDINSAIDYYIFSTLTNNCDGIVRNYLLQTFNGEKWYFAAYDLDTTFGRVPQFDDHTIADYFGDDWRGQGITFENITGVNHLFYQLWKFHKNEILNQLKNLLDNTMSGAAVDTMFIDHIRHIPQIVLDNEIKVWPETLNTSVDNVNRIGRWYMQRVDSIKNHYLNTQEAELDQLKEKVENLTNLATTSK